jgi:hypothetical protein
MKGIPLPASSIGLHLTIIDLDQMVAEEWCCPDRRRPPWV